MTFVAHITAIFIKQVKDSLTNRLTLLIFLFFPLLSIVFKCIVSEAEIQAMLPSFITMNTVMIPIISMSSSIAEEKEKHSLRMLIMSNVKAWEYLIGMSLCVFCTAFFSSLLFLLFFQITMKRLMVILVATIIGIIYSLIVGAILALLAKNQMSIGPITAPISMVLGLLPMFAKMNDNVEAMAQLIYSYYVREMFETLTFSLNRSAAVVLFVNLLILVLMFALLYKKTGLVAEK